MAINVEGEMAVDQGPEQEGSPTELAEDSELDVEVKKEKRKRERRSAAEHIEIPDDEFDKEESPSKRPQRDEHPVSSRELRFLLQQHARELKEAWGMFETRVAKVEEHQSKQTGELASLSGRTKVVEKDMKHMRLQQEAGQHKIEALTEDVKNLKMQVEAVKTSGAKAAASTDPPQLDPWANYLQQQGGRSSRPPRIGANTNDQSANSVNVGANSNGGGGDRGEELSDEDRRTLIVGGWLQDTRRAVIETEALPILQDPSIKEHIDAEKLLVFGPRRSVGMLRFIMRPEESSYAQVKDRMWKVIKAIATMKVVLESTKAAGEDKTMWAAFVKTKTARQRTAHISMARRVAMSLAADSKNSEGGVLNVEHTQATAYDMDWNTGTMWCGIHKLASATHRIPKNSECVTMTGGWINLDAVGLVAGCTVDVAKDLHGADHRQPKAHTVNVRDEPRPCEIYRWGRILQWNIGGQEILKLDLAAADADIICAQEVARSDEGWDTKDTDHFHFISYRSRDLWRGVAVGFAIDKFDSVIGKIATPRGIWLLVRLRGLGRVVVGSMHAYTGVTNAKYQGAILKFVRGCPSKWRQYPLACGIDANEVPRWFHNEDSEKGELDCSSTNLNFLATEAAHLGALPLAPKFSQWKSPTHFPRDETRVGRQIDTLWYRSLNLKPANIDGDRRHVIGTDHGIITSDVMVAQRSSAQWGNDSRPRWVVGDLPQITITEVADITDLARSCTRPHSSTGYVDSPELKDAIAAAKTSGDKKAWKEVHRLRRRNRNQWQASRMSRILNGDWSAYRQLQREKNRRRGWWGKMLADRSSEELCQEIRTHLETKLTNPFQSDWDDIVDVQIQAIDEEVDFVPFTKLEAREELQAMKANSAVGPDGTSVHLLRCIIDDEHLGDDFLALVNRIISSQLQPENWTTSFLALLAKKDFPEKPGDLRPICVSSALNKFVSRLVCGRVMPLLRVGSRVSGCGKGRQAADVLGTIARVRDITHEWKVPILLCKLDISGAFDRIDRQKICEFLKERLRGREVPAELKYLLNQMKTYHLVGQAPGGQTLKISPNVGIKQGAPESAELFGMIMDCMLSELTTCQGWKRFGIAVPGCDLQLIFYQDDIFLLETEFARLGRKVNVLERHLRTAGLVLATEKTKIIASEAYRGPRRIKVGENFFEIASPGESVKVLGLGFSFHESPSQQAKELLARTRAAAAKHRDLLRGHASWGRKLTLIKSLVEGQFKWTAGALHWAAEDLRQANVLQLHVLRDSFRLHRRPGESWVDWNSRTMRQCRAWLASQGQNRWSSCILTLQHTLHGHWARRREMIFRNGHCTEEPCLPMRALLWRSTGWWRFQQQLSPLTGVRHEGRFYASNTERQLSEVHGTRWFEVAADRNHWSLVRDEYLRRWDIRWTQGRQLALRY
ncbi:unnamed protein product [Symbiodinium sp. CCMP2592]|nr:unnamed protein product [Symbiodinium sp. CCMP2592]